MRGVIYFIILFVFLSSAFSLNSHAQKSFTDNLNVSVSGNSGCLLPEYSFLSLLTNNHIYSGEICFYKQSSGKNVWERTYNLPDKGISLFYSTLGNDSVFGNETALTYFFRVYFSDKGRLRLYNRMGIGLDYVSKIFSIKENYMNVVVGSHINIHYNCRLGVSYSISEKLSADFGLSFDHLSNANTRDPNIGLNYVTAYGAVSLRIGERKLFSGEPDNTEEKKYLKTVFIGLGGKHTRYLSSDYYYISSASAEIERRITRCFYIGTGADLYYDSSTENEMTADGKEFRTSYSFRSGMHFSQSVVYNRMTLTLQEGIYLGFTDKVSGNLIYNRGILQYRLTDKLIVRIAMKSHLHILDYPEIGIGYRF